MDQFDREMLAALPKVRAMARGLTGDADRAADLVQDTVERALRARESYVLGSNMGAWLCFIGRNVFYSERRRAWRSVQMAEGQAEAVPDVCDPFRRLELHDVLEAVELLPVEQADALLIVGATGEDYEAAAGEIGVPTGTIKSRVSRARSALEAYFRGD